MQEPPEAAREVRMRAVCLFLAILVPAIAPPTYADTPTADQVLARSAVSYDRLKSYQGTLMVLTEIGGRRETMTLTIKAVNGDDGKINRSVSEMAIDSTFKGLSHASKQRQIDDGVTVFAVRPDLKQYAKRPHAPESISGLFKGAFADAATSAHKLDVSVRRLQGRLVYELSSKEPDGELSILIDKQTYHLLSIRKWRAHKDGKSTLLMTVSNERFDQTIPGDAFKWSVPPGFAEAADGKSGRP
jgi:outer membrane lipoprotein-sorting protein